MLEGWIGIYRYGDEIRIQPTLYKTKEEAVAGIYSTLGNYRTNHLKWVCEPVYVQLQTESNE